MTDATTNQATTGSPDDEPSADGRGTHGTPPDTSGGEIPGPAHGSGPQRRLWAVKHEPPPGADSQDDLARLKSLITTYERVIRDSLRGRTGAAPLIDDVLVETFASVWLAVREDRVPGHEQAWILRIANNAFTSMVRDEQRNRKREKGNVQKFPPSRRTPDDEVADDDEIRLALNRLTPMQRNALRLKVHGRTASDAARELGITVSAYHALLWRARQQLLKSLGARRRETDNDKTGDRADDGAMPPEPDDDSFDPMEEEDHD